MVQPNFIFDYRSLNEEHIENNYRNGHYYIGTIIALSAAISSGFLNITINYCQDVKPVVLLWWAGIGAIFFSLIGFTFDPNAKMLSHQITKIPYANWIAYCSIAFLGLFGKLLLSL